MSIARETPPDISLHRLPTDSVNKKKKKRPSQDSGQDAGADDQRKKHKKPKQHLEQSMVPEHASGKKKSKKKKDKEHDQQQIHDAAATTTDLLSTIVAAAAGTPDLSQSYLPQPPYAFNSDPHFMSSEQSALLQLPQPFSDVSFGSNEDVLRALQDIDISKIANVLRTLEDAASAANVHMPSLGPPPNQLRPTALGRIPAPSNAIISNNSSLSKATPQQKTHPDHAHLLANKWLNAAKLSELVEKEGLVYRKGKFSATEVQQVKAAIEDYRVTKGLTEERLLEIIFAKKEKGKDDAFWSEITSAVPQRPLVAVYHHVRRTYHPLKLQGRWTQEEDNLLRQAVADLGQQWEKVSDRVGRMSADCRDRYRNHIIDREIRAMGPWTKEEEEQLTRIVTSMTVEQGKDIDNDVFWGKVSAEMGGKRGRQQCRIKWTDALSKTVKNDGQKPRWSQQDAYILVHKVDSLDVNDDTEIDWKTLPDPAWNFWSAHTLQRRWVTMKRSVPNYESMAHQEIVDTLKSKKATLPSPAPTNSRRRKERRVTSAAAIADADLHVVHSSPSDSDE